MRSNILLFNKYDQQIIERDNGAPPTPNVRVYVVAGEVVEDLGRAVVVVAAVVQIFVASTN